MMDRVQIGAIVLAVAAFGLYYTTLPTPQSATPARPEATAPIAGGEVPTAAPIPERPASVGRPISESRQTVIVTNDAVRMVVGSAGGRVLDLELLQFPDRKRG